MFFNATGDHLVGTRTGTSQIDSFVVLPGGRLLAAKGSPFTGQGLGQLGAEFSPARPWQLFVSNAHNGAGLGTVSAYRDGFLGRLIPDRGLAVRRRADRAVLGGDQPRRPVPVHRQHRVGEHLQLRHQPGGSLSLIGSTPIRGGGADIDLRLSPDGKTLSVDGSGNHILSVFAVHGGTLTELPSSPTPRRPAAHPPGSPASRRSSRCPWPARPGGPGRRLPPRRGRCLVLPGTSAVRGARARPRPS